MSFSFDNPLYIGDKDAAVKSDIAELQSEVGDLSQLETGDKSSLVNALNEAMDSTLNGVNRDLTNLSTVGDQKLRSLNAYANEGELLQDADGLAFVEKYAHSTFDRSKFTVVGSPNITDDGIASGFVRRSNFLYAPLDLSNSNDWEIEFEGVCGTTGSDTLIPICYTQNYESSYGSEYLRIQQSTNNRRYIVLNGDDAYYNRFATMSASNKYKFNLKFDGTEITIKQYQSGTLINTATQAASAFTNSGYLVIGCSLVATGVWTGSIDLKTIKVKNNGVDVFSGNKTGIDTIKADDYTVVGTPTISADGVLDKSVYSTCTAAMDNYVSYSLGNINLSSTVKISSKFTVIKKQESAINDVIAGGLVCARGAENAVFVPIIRANTVILDIYGGMNGGTLNWYTFTLGETYILETVETSTTRILTLYDENRNVLKSESFIKNVEQTQQIWNNVVLYISQTNVSAQPNICCKFDLNETKVWINGNLVYQPCLKIPYTESKTGSKIVNFIYRDRVNDMAEQFGYANYYTLQDEAKGIYQVVGSPTISSDFVASGFSGSNYLQYPVVQLGTYNSWTIYSPEFTTGNDITTPQFIFKITYGAFYGGIRIYFDNSKLKIDAGSDTTHDSDIFRFNTLSISANTKYQVKVSFTGTEYIVWYKEGNGSWQEYSRVSSTTKLYNTLQNAYIGYSHGGTATWMFGSIDLKQFKIYVDNKLAYEAVTEPNFTLPQVELYGLIGQRTLRDSYRNGINYWELYSNRDLEQGGSCTSGVEVTFARPFADTNYVLSVPYSAKSATAFTPTQTGDWIAKGKGIL